MARAIAGCVAFCVMVMFASLGQVGPDRQPLAQSAAKRPASAAVLPQAASVTQSARPLRGMLVSPGRVTPALLQHWKSMGANTLVIRLDESFKPAEWAERSRMAHEVGLAVYAWLEVARSPVLADAHPDWMAAIGGHHNDWRSRVPNAPKPAPGKVIKAWPWVPIGYAPAFDAQEQRLRKLLDAIPDSWEGAFVNDLQAGPSSCGCGNDQCRWALDYGSPPTAARTPGADVAARFLKRLQEPYPGKTFIPVWVIECEMIDLAESPGSTGFCGTVQCAKTACWPRYNEAWDPLTKVARGPLAVGLWASSFHRDEKTWWKSALKLFEHPLREGTSVAPSRCVAVLEADRIGEAGREELIKDAQANEVGWVLCLEGIDQSWRPLPVAVKAQPTRAH